MGGFAGETGVSRLVLRAVSLSSAVGGIVAVSGIDYYAQQFYDYLFLGLCGLWSLINIGLLLFKRSSHPGYCILFDMLLVAASAFLVTVSGIGAAFKGYDLIGRGIAAVVFAAVEL
ncbi:hypothetical protein N7504_001824 [Penicillium tannophilum]|nr:hypothetical protein N7504_001824 [Penicillium tannophilum]